jgi:hypothetical protein
LCQDRFRARPAACEEGVAMDVSRRDFIRLGTSAAVTTAAVAQAGAGQSAPVLLAQGGQALPLGFDPADPGLEFDLVIANGEVLDPSQALRGKRDLGIENGQVAAILPAIPADRSVQRILVDPVLLLSPVIAVVSAIASLEMVERFPSTEPARRMSCARAREARYRTIRARVAELADALDLGSRGSTPVGVQLPPLVPEFQELR